MITLPTKYYLDYFLYLLQFVAKQYDHVLTADEKKWLQLFTSLPEDAQCLWLRMYNRKGLFFKWADLQYAEINQPEQALQTLITHHFATTTNQLKNNETAATMPRTNISLRNVSSNENYSNNEKLYVDLLQVFTKDELLALGKLALVTKEYPLAALRKLKKEELVQVIKEKVSFADCLEWADNQVIVKQNFEQEANFIRFLFFGNAYQDMTEFVLRDIAIRHFQNFEETQFTPQFQTRQEAEEKFKWAEASRLFANMKQQNVEIQEIATYFLAYFAAQPLQTEIARNSYNRLVLQVAAQVEKAKLWAEALALYQFATLPPAREKQVRLLAKLTRQAEAYELCLQIAEKPQNAAEQTFAADWLAQYEVQQAKKEKKENRRNEAQANENQIITNKSIRSVTQYLKAAPTLVVDSQYKNQVELGVLATLQVDGYAGVFVENYVWRGIFALTFWNIVFDSHIHHPLQSRPSDFYLPTFFASRQPAILQLLENLQTTEQLINWLSITYENKQGLQNNLVEWHEVLLPLVVLVVGYLPLPALKAVLLEMWRQPKDTFKGFPDLFVWKETHYSFIEVKSPTDNLSAQQLYWLRFFDQVGITAKVLRVEFQEI